MANAISDRNRSHRRYASLSRCLLIRFPVSIRFNHVLHSPRALPAPFSPLEIVSQGPICFPFIVSRCDTSLFKNFSDTKASTLRRRRHLLRNTCVHIEARVCEESVVSDLNCIFRRFNDVPSSIGVVLKISLTLAVKLEY